MNIIQNKDLKKRILDLSFKYKLSHLGSNLTAVDIIDEIYKHKLPNDIFVLSSGHAGLALYAVIEKYEGIDAEKIWLHHGVHPDRCADCRIYCSSGSLGQGLPIAVGMALADKNRRVCCLISDGECSEGSIYEALNVAEDKKLTNLKVFLNYNSWGAYRSIEEQKIQMLPFWYAVCPTNVEQFPFLKGQDAHYKVMREEEYKQALELLK